MKQMDYELNNLQEYRIKSNAFISLNYSRLVATK